MNFFIGLLLGAAIVFVVYHFNLQPKLRAERDALMQKLQDRFKDRTSS